MLVVAAACFVALFVLQALLRSNTRRRNYEVFTEMVYSASAKTQAAAAALPGAMTQQRLGAGVVVRGAAPFRYGPEPEEAERAGRELTNPFAPSAPTEPGAADVPDDPAVLARGAELYGRFCVVCHGPDGAGFGPVVLRGMLPPPAMQGANAMEMPDGKMFHVLTRGQGKMASYAAQVAPEDRWKVIRHVRKLQEQP